MEGAKQVSVSLASGRQYPAVWWQGHAHSTGKPLVLVWNYSDHSTSTSGAVRKYPEKTERDKHIQYNTSTLPPGRPSAFICNLTPISFIYQNALLLGEAGNSRCLFIFHLLITILLISIKGQQKPPYLLCRVPSSPGISFWGWGALSASLHGSQIAIDVILVPFLWIFSYSAIPC